MSVLHERALTERIIGLAINVHRALGPGLLETAYEECLCFELKSATIAFARPQELPVTYRNVRLDCGYRVDIVVEQTVLLELKAIERLAPIHDAQMLTYLRLSRMKVGLLMNFNAVLLKDGLRRFVM